jgi:hypothetical protein
MTSMTSMTSAAAFVTFVTFVTFVALSALATTAWRYMWCDLGKPASPPCAIHRLSRRLFAKAFDALLDHTVCARAPLRDRALQKVGLTASTQRGPNSHLPRVAIFDPPPAAAVGNAPSDIAQLLAHDIGTTTDTFCVSAVEVGAANRGPLSVRVHFNQAFGVGG